MENGSINKSGVNLKVKNKVVPVCSNPEARPRCLVYLLDKYFNKFPPMGIDMYVFYLCPVFKTVSDVQPWYDCSPVGKKS